MPTKSKKKKTVQKKSVSKRKTKPTKVVIALVEPVPKKKTERRFILCPTCQSKSKKLFSEMGGLQTRKCQKGHLFEVDMFFGFPMGARRVERTDRPIFTPGSYTDYVYGRFKDDPTGKNS